MARLLFPGGVLVEEKPWEHGADVKRTAALMADRSASAIFEAAFEHSGVRVRVDVLERLPRGYWGIREVKSSGEVKDHHYDDVAVQVHVLGGAVVPPPLPRDPRKNGDDERSAKSESPKRTTPIVGIVATGLGLASVIVPYFAAVFFAPAALICGVIALSRSQRGWGTVGVLLGLLGVVGIVYTSQQIAGIFTREPSRYLSELLPAARIGA